MATGKQIQAASLGEWWAMDPRRMETLSETLAGVDLAAMDADSVAAAKAEVRRAADAPLERRGATAVVPIAGIILKEVPWYFARLGIAATGTRTVERLLGEALADETIADIELAVESPGGTVSGVQALADVVHAANAQKPVVARVEDLAASAAYWLAAQAGRITANPTALIGSIGVFVVWYDFSKAFEDFGFKAHLISSGALKGGGAGVPISEEKIAAEQKLIDELADLFVAAVARGRGLNETKVRSWATGQVWLAAEAVNKGLIDGLDRFASAGPDNTGDLEMADNAQPIKGEAGELRVAKGFGEDLARAKAEGAQEATGRLKALEAAFGDDPAFARAMWEQGKTVEQATTSHYAVVVKKLGEVQAALTAATAQYAEELQAKTTELEELKAGLARTGTEALVDTKDAQAGGGDAVTAYKAKIEELVQAGDPVPERTVAKKFPAIQAAYLAAVNAGAQVG